MMRAHGKRKKHAKTTDFRLIDEAAERRTRPPTPGDTGSTSGYNPWG